MLVTEKFLKDELTEYELVNVWNAYCLNNYYMGLCINNMDYIDDILQDKKPSEILSFIVDNHFTIEDTYFRYSNYDLESTSKPRQWMDFEELLMYINEHDYEFKHIPKLWDRLNEDNDTRLIVLREGNTMNDDAMIFETNAPEEELENLEHKCQMLLKQGKDVDELPTWSTELEAKEYVFDLVDEFPNYLQSDEVEDVDEQYFLEGE